MLQRTGVSRAIAFLSSGLLALSLAGCGADDQQANSEQKIFGGTKVTAGAWPTTIAITNSFGMFCSGTAIHPKVIVTAGHCARGSRPASTNIYVGDGKEGGSVKGQYAVEAIKASPKYSSSDNDIAYVLLKEPLDIPAKDFVPVLTDADEIEELLAIGNAAHLVGFGNRNGGGFGVKFEVTTKITKITANEIYIGGSGKDTCQGDSGGPVFGKLANGEWRVYGVTSRGGACGTGGIYGLMHANICWIQEDSKVDLGLKAGTCEPKQPQVPDENEDNDSNEETADNSPGTSWDNWWDSIFG